MHIFSANLTVSMQLQSVKCRGFYFKKMAQSCFSTVIFFFISWNLEKICSTLNGNIPILPSSILDFCKQNSFTHMEANLTESEHWENKIQKLFIKRKKWAQQTAFYLLSHLQFSTGTSCFFFILGFFCSIYQQINRKKMLQHADSNKEKWHYLCIFL